MSTSPRSTSSAGWSQAVKRNYPQREIADAAFELQREIDAGERVVVGVNRYVQENEEPIPTLRVDPALERKQIDRLQSARARRDGAAVERTLAALREDGRALRAQPDGSAARLRPRPRQRGRDRRVAAAGLRRLQRDPRLLRASRETERFLRNAPEIVSNFLQRHRVLRLGSISRPTGVCNVSPGHDDTHRRLRQALISAAPWSRCPAPARSRSARSGSSPSRPPTARPPRRSACRRS